MPMYNLLEYGGNYSTASSLLNYNRDEVNHANDANDANEINDNGSKTNNNKTITNKSFEDITEIIGRAPDNNTLDAKVVVPLKYLSNFWRSLHLLFNNCVIEPDFPWSKKIYYIRNINNT